MIRLNSQLMKKRLNETMEFIRENEQGQNQERTENGKIQKQSDAS